MNNPLVSVIMPVYNGEKYIAQAIKSVLFQSYPNFELIIIDDGSIDSTAKIIGGFKDKRIKYLKLNENCGPAKARNIGLDIMQGEYVTFIDADDLWARNRIEILLNTIEKVGVGFFVADDVVRFFEKSGKLIPYKSLLSKTRLCKDNDIFIIDSLKNYFDISKKYFDISSIQPLIKVKDISENNIRFCENLKIAEDDIFYIELFLKGKKLAICNSQSYFYRKNYSSLTRETDMKVWEKELSQISELIKVRMNSLELENRYEIIDKIIAKVEKKIIYGVACNYINSRNFSNTYKIIIKNPWIIPEIINDIILSRTIFNLKFKEKCDLQIKDLMNNI